MSRINVSRVVVGGLLAGLVINVGEFLLNGPIAGDEFEALLTEAGFEPFAGSAIAAFVVLGFIAGLVLVALYAGFRARWGPGPGTAVRASLPAWFFGYVMPSVGMYMMGLLTTGLMVIGLTWGLVEFAAAAVVGAWYYTEGETPDASAATPAAPVMEEQTRREAPAGGSAGGGFGGEFGA